MSINMANVKSITLGGVSVKKIENLNGDVLWEGTPALSSITISGYTTSFTQNDTFVFGGTVTAHYTNGSTQDVTSSAVFSGYNMSSVGSQTVTVTYTESGVTKTTTYNITVYTTSTTTVNVPITTIATFAATSSNYYIKPNAAYRSQATNYIATQLGIDSARIKTQVWGKMRIDFYQYNSYASTQKTYALLSTSTSSSSAMSNYIYSGNSYKTATYRQPMDLTYNGSTDIPSLSNVNYWIWLAVNRPSTPSTYYRTSSSTVTTYIRVDDKTLSNSYIPITVTYQSL